MFGWGDSGLCPLGIDIGTQAVKVLQLRYRRGQYLVQAAARVELAAPSDQATRDDQLVAALRKVLEGRKFLGTRCVTALPAKAFQARSVRLPQMPDADLVQAVGWEAKDRFGAEFEDGSLAYFRAGEVRRGTEIRDELLLFAAAPGVLRDHIGQLKAAGLKPLAIDLQPTAMLRALSRGGELAQTAAIADVGQSGTQFLIAHRGRLVFYKHVEIGGSSINAAVAHKLGVPVEEAVLIRRRMASGAQPEADGVAEHVQQAVMDAARPVLEELAHELDMCIRYYVVTFRGTRPEVLTLVGGQARCPQLIETLATVLGSQVEPGLPLRGVANLTQATRPDQSSDWAVATGLSLYTRQASVPVEVAA